MTKYEVQYYHDVHRIAAALEKIAKYFTEDNKIEVKEITDEEKEKSLEKRNIFNPISISPSVNDYFPCEGCSYYQTKHYQRMKNSNKFEFGDCPCNWCPKLQPTCEVTDNDK